MHENLQIRQLILRILIGGLVLSASTGIYVFLFGDFGEVEARILLTTLSVSYFSVTSLACAAAFEKKIWPAMAVPGMVLGAIGFLMFVVGIWAEWWESEPYAKAMILAGIFSFSLAQACLLSLANLAPRFQWTLYGGLGCVFALAAVLSAMVVFEADDEWLFRFAGVIGILDGCATVSIPVLHKLSKGLPEPQGSNESTQLGTGPFQEIELRCPRCSFRGRVAFGETECKRCSLKLRVELMDQLRAHAPLG